MADELDTLIAKATKHLRDRKGELLALETQLRAGRSAYDDLNKEIGRSQDELQKIRDQLADADNQFRGRGEDAAKAASQILNSAHSVKVEAAKVVKDAENRAKGIVAEAEARSYAIETEVKSKKAELQSTLNQLNAAESKLRALKKDAADWGAS